MLYMIRLSLYLTPTSDTRERMTGELPRRQHISTTILGLDTHHFLPDGRTRTSAVAVAAAAADATVTPTTEHPNPSTPESRSLLPPLRSAKNEFAGLHLCVASLVEGRNLIAISAL